MKLNVNRMRLEHLAKAAGMFDRLLVRPDWQDYSMMGDVERRSRDGARTYTAFVPLPPREQVIEVIDINFDTGEVFGRWVNGPFRGCVVHTSVNFVWPVNRNGDIYATQKSHPYGDRQL